MVQRERNENRAELLPPAERAAVARVRKGNEMSLQISEGKKKPLQAVVNAQGVIAALTVDQCSSFRRLSAKEMNTEADAGPTEKLPQFKVQNIENVNECLTAALPWFSVPCEAEAARPPRTKGKDRP
ncbi:MAG TPA: hypothetical protein VED66_16655 [Candidatus Sulfotelmatobacter sp.]|nr:hypothetical protein [Candidatus Sulfotelmatobacter sp.]